MLRQHSQFMLTLMILADAAAIGTAWLVSFWLRFAYLPVDPAKGVPAFDDKYLPMLPLVVLTHLIIFQRIRLYRPRRDDAIWHETRDILKAFCVAIGAIVLLDYAMPASNKISRSFLLTYAVVGTFFFALFRAIVRTVLQVMRRRGFNRRTAAIIGAGRNAQRVLHALRNNPWTGLDVLYFVDDFAPDQQLPRAPHGVPLRGPLADLRDIVEANPVDAVFVALSTEQGRETRDVLQALETTPADVRLVPELHPTYTLRSQISELDGVPIISLRHSPLHGSRAIVKQAFDLVVGAICLLIGALPMMLIACIIKLTSRGPVFYRQRRMGLDGAEFSMIKFRTMRVDAEHGSGPVWSRKHDDRRTTIGRFLRRTSLDELPNLFNVLAGQMSLVGPRPERPEFIARFKHEIPRYMLRHKIKAGMTGYAQIKGLRGDTSLKKRIQCDLYYIRNWSLWLDIRILLQTVFGVWFSRHET
ncbi:MAG: undecaprenyl-phosphate glucose phosphotransferase [Phycisphaerales bacterium]|nr:undecaprenyl-phosphate glucose phosphotransferase [Phycisphaerales bacterium]